MPRIWLKQGGVAGIFGRLCTAFVAQTSRLDTSISPASTITKLRSHKLTNRDLIYVLHVVNAAFWLYVIEGPSFLLKLGIPVLFILGLLIPLTSQLLVPAIPLLAWALTLYASRFLPPARRPTISVTVLPTLETVLYGANISDVLTRFTHPALDVIAWLPYGVLHYSLPIVVTIIIWLLAPRPALQYWASAFGYVNLLGVLCKIVFPCAPPWYELIYGLTPANYTMPGSAAGLARIDALFGGTRYQTMFLGSPVVFGAFPSLRAACATLEALFLSHFFPAATRFVWAYAFAMYWATMYLAHNYLIDVVAGASLAILTFHFFMPASLRIVDTAASSAHGIGRRGRNKYEVYDLEDRRRYGGIIPGSPQSSLSSGRHSLSLDEEGQDITYGGRSPAPLGSAAPFIVPSPLPHDAKAWKGIGPVPSSKAHRHTASIASLIRADDRVESGWSPVTTTGFVFPPVKTASVSGDSA